MTVEEFFVVFEQYAPLTRWVLKDGIYLRSEDGYCPICFVAKHLNLNPANEKSGLALLVAAESGMGWEEMKVILRAADNLPSMDRAIRDRMLRVVELAPKL